MSTTAEDDPDTMPEGELLALPGEAIPPGWLTEFFARRSALVHQHDFDELMLELSGDSGRAFMIFPDQDPREKRRREEEQHRRALLAYEESMCDIRERSDRMLAQIEVRQREIEKRRQEIEEYALRLHDGRRAYVDGDRYRDEEGRVLEGVDADEAGKAHRDKPDASTWDQRQKVRQQLDEIEHLRQQVQKEREDAERSGQGFSADELDRQRKEAEQRMTGYEKGLHAQIETSHAGLAARSDIGSAYADVSLDDYAGPAGGGGKTSTVAFASAAKGYANDPHETIVETAQDQSIKKAPQPSGQGAKSNV